jgi:hypothetical protein
MSDISDLTDVLLREVNWLFQHLCNQGCDGRALRSGQGYVGKERMSLKGFDYGDDTVMTAHSQVISLGNIVSQDDS